MKRGCAYFAFFCDIERQRGSGANNASKKLICLAETKDKKGESEIRLVWCDFEIIGDMIAPCNFLAWYIQISQ